MRISLTLVIGLLTIGLAVGCDRSTATPSAAQAASSSVHSPSQTDVSASKSGESSAPVHPQSPIEVVRRAHEFRVAGNHSHWGPLLVPEQRSDVSRLVLAMDRLLSANRALQEVAAARLGPATAALFDRSPAGDAIGLFSMNVRVMSERIDGDEAEVTYQVAGRVPLERVRLVLRNGDWLIETDPPIPEVVEALADLARVLLSAADRLERENLSADQLQRELESQQAPVLRRLDKLTRK